MEDPRHPGENIRCNQPNCGKILNSRYLLKKHMDSCHFGVKPYECQICFKRFSSKQNKREHVRIEHSYSCEEWNFRVKNQETINCDLIIPKLSALLFKSFDPDIRPYSKVAKIYLFSDMFDKVKLPEIAEDRKTQVNLPVIEG